MVSHCDDTINDDTEEDCPPLSPRTLTESCNTSLCQSEDSDLDPWTDLKRYRSNHAQQMIIGALNVNSIRNKYPFVKYILESNFIDCFSIVESKLDGSFPDSQFYAKGFNLFRQDSTSRSGGIMTWIRNDIANSRRYDLEVNNVNIQTLCLEMHIRKEKWFIVSVYRLPGANFASFVESLSLILDKILSESKMINIIGDVNVNMNADDNKSNIMKDLVSSYSLSNLIDEPTCFKGDTPSLIDVILVSNRYRYGKCLNSTCGLSDFHNLIACCTKIKLPKPKVKTIYYRSYKHFTAEDFRADIARIPFQIVELFDDVNDKYWAFSSLIDDVVDTHAPLKKKFLKKENCAHMNSKLRKIMFKKRMAQNKYWRDKGNKKKWEEYRLLRNEFVKESKISRRIYFKERCKDGLGNRNFWQTIKPYLTDKTHVSNDIMLREDNNVITDSSEIANIFNDYFKAATEGIGFAENNDGLSVDEIWSKYRDHDSIINILGKATTNDFTFVQVSTSAILKLLSNINPNKSVGYDKFPPKLLREAKEEFAPYMRYLVNCSLENCSFPNDLKKAEISPVFKKTNRLDKTKYRPVSILPCFSKIYEKVIDMQLGTHFYDNIAGHLSAYRRNHSTQSVLIRAVEDWRLALDQGKYVGALLMDLSKAFDVIPHGLLVAKLRAYGYGTPCITLILNYLSYRSQRVRINNVRSTWNDITKGVPQGSILGPTLFNVFMNDIFYTITDCPLYNYADDNTVSYSCDSASELKITLEKYGNEMTDWFTRNGMSANPDKYQVIIFGHKEDCPTNITIKGNSIVSQPQVNLLGISIDSNLTFNMQIDDVCKKAGRQINAVMRLCNVLDTEVKVAIYKSFIQSNFNYCPVIWLICGETNLSKLAKLQYRALKFVYNDFTSDYEQLLLKGNHVSMSVHLMHTVAVEVYKCMYNIAPEYIQALFERHNHCYGTRNESKIVQKRFNTVRHGYYSFKYLGAKIWNNLPRDVKACTSINEFKRNLKSWKNCSCLARGVIQM